MHRTLRSDNNAGLVPEALQAISEANAAGHMIGYGDDEITAAAVEAFRERFGRETAVYFVATGTAANCLAIASLTRPWQHVICHSHSHYNDDESTAPERFTQCRAVPVHKAGSKLEPADITAIAENARGDVHQPQPGVVTVSNATEFGEVYTASELTALCQTAHAHGYRVHVDGARFANAVAACGCDARDLSSLAGVDALSFGGTKNGLACSEALLFFPQGDGHAFHEAVASFEYHRKATGHLLSKHRFITAPFLATLQDDIWLAYARHANEMAQRLADGLRDLGFELAFPTQANAVFVRMDDSVHEALQEMGHGYYPFGDRSQRIYRLMCSFDTPPDDIDAFLQDARRAAASGR